MKTFTIGGGGATIPGTLRQHVVDGQLVIPAYNLGSEREHNEWVRNVRTAAKQHKYLLDIIDEGAIRPGAEREAEAMAMHVRYKTAGIADGLIAAKM